MENLTTFFKNLNQRQKIVAVSIFAVVILAILSSIYIVTTRIGKIGTKIMIAPFATNVELNGSKVKNNKTNYLLEGEYHLVATLDHFETIERDIVIDKDHTVIINEMTPSDDEGQTYMKKHTSEYGRVETMASKLANKEGQERISKYPILKYLPLNNSIYSISYSFEDGSEEPTILVKTDYEYLDVAVAKMKLFEGVKLEDYKINFSVKNPYLYYGNSSSSDPETFIREIFHTKSFMIKKTTDINEEYTVVTLYNFNSTKELSYAHYHAVLRKKGNSWELAALPQPLYTKHNSGQIPEDVIKTINSL